jgi:hypothetical protein
MSTRERWTIYPLLFLALGVALRDKLTATVDSKFITCEDLEIVDRHGQLQMHLTGHEGESGKLLVLEHGEPRVVISSSKAGGAVTALDHEKNLLITLGHEKEESGVMAENRKNRAMFSARFEPHVSRRESRGRRQAPATEAPATQAAGGTEQPPAEQKAAAPWFSGRKIP